jgi:hypothetical protein
MAIASCAAFKTCIVQVYSRAVSHGGAFRQLREVVFGERIVSELRRMAREKKGSLIVGAAPGAKDNGSGVVNGDDLRPGSPTSNSSRSFRFSSAPQLLRRAMSFSAARLQMEPGSSPSAVSRDAAPEVALSIVSALGSVDAVVDSARFARASLRTATTGGSGLRPTGGATPAPASSSVSAGSGSGNESPQIETISQITLTATIIDELCTRLGRSTRCRARRVFFFFFFFFTWTKQISPPPNS